MNNISKRKKTLNYKCKKYVKRVLIKKKLKTKFSRDKYVIRMIRIHGLSKGNPPNRISRTIKGRTIKELILKILVSIFIIFLIYHFTFHQRCTFLGNFIKVLKIEFVNIRTYVTT